MANKLSKTLPITVNCALEANSEKLVELAADKIAQLILKQYQKPFKITTQVKKLLSPYLATYIGLGNEIVITRDLLHRFARELDPEKMELIFEGFEGKRKFIEKIYLFTQCVALPYEVGCTLTEKVSQGLGYVYSECLSLQPPRSYLSPSFNSFIDGFEQGTHLIATRFFTDMFGRPAAQALHIVLTPVIKKAVAKISNTLPVFEDRLNHLSEYFPPETLINLFFSATGNIVGEIAPLMKSLQKDPTYVQASEKGKIIIVLRILADKGKIPGLTKEQIQQLTEENFHEKIEEFTAAVMKKFTTSLLPMLLPPQVAAYSHFLSVMADLGEEGDFLKETLDTSLSKWCSILSDFDKVQEMIEGKFQREKPLDFSNKELYRSYLSLLFDKENEETTVEKSEPKGPLNKMAAGAKNRLKKNVENHVKNKLIRLSHQPFLVIAHFYFLDAFFNHLSQIIVYEEQLKNAQEEEALPPPVTSPKVSDAQVEQCIEFFTKSFYSNFGGKLLSFLGKRASVGKKLRKKITQGMEINLNEGWIKPVNYNLMLNNFVSHIMTMKNIQPSEKENIKNFFSFYFNMYAKGFAPEEAQTKVMGHMQMLSEMSEENLDRYFMNKKDVYLKGSKSSKNASFGPTASTPKDIRKEIEDLLEVQNFLYNKINELKENKVKNRSKIKLIKNQMIENQKKISILEKQFNLS